MKSTNMKSTNLTHINLFFLVALLALPVQLAAQHTRYKLIDIGTLAAPLVKLTVRASSSPMKGRSWAERTRLRPAPTSQD